MNNENMVKRDVFDEAMRVGNQSIDRANKQMQISRVAIDAIVDALAYMKVGRITQARDRLDRALVAVTRMSKP